LRQRWYWFAGEADAGFAYRLHGGVAVTLGGAFDADRRRDEIGAAFGEFCGDDGSPSPSHGAVSLG